MRRRLGYAFVADAVVVVAFAAIGRRNHDESNGVAGVLGTAAPFLIGLVVAWTVVATIARSRGRDLHVLLLPDHGVPLALLTATVGLLARRTLWDRGTAVAFVVVAAVFLTVVMGGWRAVSSRRLQRREASGSVAG